jgi:hypothetical protein
MRLRQLSILLVLVAILPVNGGLCAEKPEKAAEPVKKQSKITIGKETTDITKPLDAEGYPDYVAAINERMSEGITAENNAAVLIVQAMGPKVFSTAAEKEAIKRLGIDDLPENGPYLVSQDEIIKQWRAGQLADKQDSDELLEKQFTEAQIRPWSDDEFPIVAKWIAVNQKPLEIVVRATERPRYYFPLVSSQTDYPPVISILLPMTQVGRDFARLLAAQSMQRLAKEDVDGAWQDLLVCRRLGRLIGQGAFLIDALVGDAIIGITATPSAAIAHYEKLSAKQAAEMKRQLEALEPVPNLASKVDFCERFACLDAVTYTARTGTFMGRKIFDLISGALPQNQPQPSLPFDIDTFVDWNPALRVMNQAFDRLESIVRISDVRARREQTRKFEAGLTELSRDIRNVKSWALDLLFLTPPRTMISQRVGRLFVLLMLPAESAANRAEERTTLYEQMVQTAFALAGYRADHGEYPEKLDALVPQYLAAVPDDTFAEKPTPIRYRRTKDAFRLWSVSYNGIDDDGRDEEDDPKADDFLVAPAIKK